MALEKNRLLEALDDLREVIRHEEAVDNKIPLICTDEVIKEIADKKPLKKSDFLAISGIGKVFVEKYADRFLEIVLGYYQDEANEVNVSDNAYHVLDQYKNRMTNLSRRNKNIYMGKIIKRQCFDLSLLAMDEDLIDFLTNRRLSVIQLRLPNVDAGQDIERDLTVLYREINKEDKETGSYDLYIGYPFVEGVLGTDSLMIKAPLLFVPVKLVRQKHDFFLKKDKEKDIKYNRDLLLAISKLNNSELDIQTLFDAPLTIKNIEKMVLPFYQKHGLSVKETTLKAMEPFQNELKQSFLKRRKNMVHPKAYMVLGHYKLYSSMIQKDMDMILSSTKYNDLLEGLIDHRQNPVQADKAFEMDRQTIDESNINYITDLNFSQEKVIEMVENEKKLVIWGPPGTGKSQTITNLIASRILKGENVLVISEKKVALDVIYSRLKNASTYAMFIDDADDKQGFYQQLKAMIDPLPPMRTLNNDAYSIEEKINQIMSSLDTSMKLMYQQKIQGVPMYRLYERYVRDNQIVENLIPLHVHSMFKHHLKDLNFGDLYLIEEAFKDKSHLREYLDYRRTINRYPMLNDIKTKLNRSEILLFKRFDQAYKDYQEAIKKVWFFKRRKLKKAFIKDYLSQLDFLISKKKLRKAYLDLLIRDNRLHHYLFEYIKDLDRIKYKYQQLSPFLVKYLDMLLYHPMLRKIEHIENNHHYLFDAYYTGYLEDFMARNQKYLYILDKYQEKLKELDDLLALKQKVTKESFEMKLYQKALNFSNSKRVMDIKRILDNTRKMSVRAFISHFQVELMNHVGIWLMTPEVVSATMPLIYGMFDLVIFDEASQMYVENGIPAIYRAKKVVIAGDTKQLRPTSLGFSRLDQTDELYEDDLLRDIAKDAESLLDLAKYKYKETILNYHYRSQFEELIAFSNHAFYDAKLIVSPNQQRSDKTPIEYVHVKQGLFDKRRNEEEAKQVIKLLRKIFKERQHQETIGVITFNVAQRDLIENLIDQQLFMRSKYQKLFEQELFRQEEGEDRSLFVKNIENVQGDERDIIIFSMGYARNDDGIVRRQFGWLNNEGGQNRLNVAISRAKKKIYFVSSLTPEEFKVEDLKSIGPKLLKDYMRYCYYISNHKTTLAKTVLEGLSLSTQGVNKYDIGELVADIKKRLERNNYQVHEAIGIGSYHIDLAVYDEDLKAYKLGIICDVENNDHLDARKDLLHQEKYLHARQWTLYRVFSSNWYRDPNKEMRQIRELLK